MFKKVIHIIVSLLLLVTTAGYTVSKHFCENRLVSFSLSSNSDSCNEEKSDDCCHDFTSHFQVKNNFNLKQVFLIPDIPAGEDSIFKTSDNFSKEEIPDKNLINVAKIFTGKAYPDLSVLQRYLL